MPQKLVVKCERKTSINLYPNAFLRIVPSFHEFKVINYQTFSIIDLKFLEKCTYKNVLLRRHHMKTCCSFICQTTSYFPPNQGHFKEMKAKLLANC